MYNENENCLIRNGSDPNLNGWNISFNDENVLSNEDIKECNILSDYFNKSRNLEQIDRFFNFSTVNLSLPDDYYYINNFKISESCWYSDNINAQARIVIIVIPIVYLFTAIVLIIIYCKYKKVSNKYERLKEEKDNSKEIKGNKFLF